VHIIFSYPNHSVALLANSERSRTQVSIIRVLNHFDILYYFFSWIFNWYVKWTKVKKKKQKNYSLSQNLCKVINWIMLIIIILMFYSYRDKIYFKTVKYKVFKFLKLLKIWFYKYLYFVSHENLLFILTRYIFGVNQWRMSTILY